LRTFTAKRRGRPFLVIYLAVFLALAPGAARAGAVDSQAVSATGEKTALADYLVEAGLSRETAEALAAEFQGSSAELPLPRAGAGTQTPDEDVTTELGIVFVCMVAILGGAAWAASSAFH